MVTLAIEDAERLFRWHVLYRAQTATDPARALRSPKKLYPADPFAWHVLASWAAGDTDPWARAVALLGDPTARGGFVEAVAGDHLVRAAGPFALYHRADQGQGTKEEIDLVLHRRGARARLEIKYRQMIKPAHRKYLAQYGGGVLATVDQIEFHPTENVADIPLHMLLAGMADPISLYPTHLP